MVTFTPSPESEATYPIGSVSEMTGVNAVTLRAWERRYGLITPVRTPKGHRLYTEMDIDLIKHIQKRLAEGLSISQVARTILQASDAESVERENIWQQYMDDMIAAIEMFEEHKLNSIYNEVISLYPVDIVTSKCIMPLLELLGERWETKQGSVAEEHFFSVFMRNKLGARFHHQNLQNRGPKIVAACLPGELHEFGLLLFALNAHSRGYRVVLLGANMPIEELASVAERTQCHAIVLSGCAQLECKEIASDVKKLIKKSATPVFIGGSITETCNEQITQCGAHSLGTDFTAGINTFTQLLNNTHKFKKA